MVVGIRTGMEVKNYPLILDIYVNDQGHLCGDSPKEFSPTEGPILHWAANVLKVERVKQRNSKSRIS